MPETGNNKRLYCILLLVIGGCFYFIVRNTPLYVDDYHFLFFTKKIDFSYIHPIYGHLSFYTDRFAGVARFVPHLLVALCSLVLGKGAFNLLASVCFLLLSYLIARIGACRRSQVLPLSLVAAAVMWFVIPGFFQACLWMSGACNYLFAISIVLIFYLLLQSDRFARTKWWSLPLWTLSGVIAGWTNEGFVVGLAAGLFIHYSIFYRSRLNARRIFMLSGFFLGVICLCLAPYNVDRFLSGQDDTGFVAKIAMLGSAVLALGNLRVTFLLVFSLFVLIVFRKRFGFRLKIFARENDILLISFAVSLIFLILTRHDSENSRFPVEIYSLLLLISVIGRYATRAFVPGLSIVGTVGVLISTVFLAPKCLANNRAYDDMRMQIENGRRTVVAEDVKLSSFERRYIAPLLFSAYQSLKMNGMADIVRYYGGDPSTVILSRDLSERLMGMEPGDKGVRDQSWGMTWICLPDDAVVRNVTFSLNPVEPSALHFWERWFDRYRLMEVPSHIFKVYDVAGHRWLVVLDNPMIAKRLNKIVVEYTKSGPEKY